MEIEWEVQGPVNPRSMGYYDHCGWCDKVDLMFNMNEDWEPLCIICWERL